MKTRPPLLLSLLFVLLPMATLLAFGCAMYPEKVPQAGPQLQQAFRDIYERHTPTLARIVDDNDRGVMALIQEMENLSKYIARENEQLRAENQELANTIAIQNEALGRITSK